MYAKVFSSLFDGSLRGRAHPILVFINLLASADRDGTVDKHWRAIAQEVGLTEVETKDALAELEAPDPESRTPADEGRRIVRVSDTRTWGWRIVNHAKYRAIRSEEDRREQNRVAQAARRSKSKCADSQQSQPASAASQHQSAVYAESAKSAHSESESEAEAETEAHAEEENARAHASGGDDATRPDQEQTQTKDQEPAGFQHWSEPDHEREPAGEALFSGDQQPQSIPAPVERTDEDEWRYRVARLDWVKQLKTINAKIGPKNWRPWEALHDRFPDLIGSVKKLSAEKRWPSEAEMACEAGWTVDELFSSHPLACRKDRDEWQAMLLEEHREFIEKAMVRIAQGGKDGKPEVIYPHQVIAWLARHCPKTNQPGGETA
jgi:hypothetical protein